MKHEIESFKNSEKSFILAKRNLFIAFVLCSCFVAAKKIHPPPSSVKKMSINQQPCLINSEQQTKVSADKKYQAGL
jgi:hypothetical protein